MARRTKQPQRPISAPYLAPGPTGVAVRGRLKDLTGQDEKVLDLVGAHLGALASRDLKTRCRQGHDHTSRTWAERKRDLTAQSSSRWAGALTKATHEQYALARRNQAAHLRSLEQGVRTLQHRLSQPLGSEGTKHAPGGYRTRQEWFAKSRRLHTLRHKLETVRTEFEEGRVRVVRGGKKLARHRHHLQAAGLTEEQWRWRWQAARAFLQADGESGKRYGNETLRITPEGEVSIKLPAPLAHLANAPNGRYVLACRVSFQHRGAEWADRIEADRAVAYRIHLDTERGRWYVTASWTTTPVTPLSLEAARAQGMVGVDTNADHFAAYHLDVHGNPVGGPRRFFYDLSGPATRRDAQIRHALTRLLHWARRCGVAALGIEDLDFAAEKTREKHGRKKKFRKLISNIPTSKLKARLVSMAAEQGLAIVAVDPAYTSMWGAQHWREPLASNKRKMTRHDAASVAIGRRALGHPIRRRTAPPHDDRSDRRGPRTVQAPRGGRGREGTRPLDTDRAHDARARNRPKRTRGTSASKTVRGARSSGTWQQMSPLDTD